MSLPSISKLFHRSNFHRSEEIAGENVRHIGQERLEVFAVAAVGFAFKHCSQFRRKFLMRIRGLNGDLEGFAVDLQSDHHSDLRVMQGHCEKVNVEFNIRAILELHQDLSKQKFTSKRGYASLTNLERYFVVAGQKTEFVQTEIARRGRARPV